MNYQIAFSALVKLCL